MDLEKVEELAKLFFTEEQIELILKSDSEIEDFDTAFKKGRLLSEYEVRKTIFKMATQGSSPAQKEWLQIMREVKIEEKQRR